MPKSVLAIEALTDFGDTSALLISLTSNDKTYRELGEMMDDLRDRLRTVESVGAMNVVGKHKEQIAVYVDNDKLTHYGIKASTLATTLFTQGFNTTGGQLKGEWYNTPIYVDRTVNSVADVADMVVLSLPDGGIVRLRDIAKVVREYPEASSFITNNGTKSLLLSVEMKGGNNVVEMGRKVQVYLDEFEKTLPHGVSLFKKSYREQVIDKAAAQNEHVAATC